MAAAATRSVYVDSALHVVKGAVCAALRVPTGRTTESVKSVPANHSGSIVINSVPKCSKDDQDKIRELVDNKVAENVPYFIYDAIPRKQAVELFGDTMFDKFPVPETVSELRLCRLEGWNLNCQINPVVRSTGELGKVELTKFKFNEGKGVLEISLTVHPEKEGLLCCGCFLGVAMCYLCV